MVTRKLGSREHPLVKETVRIREKRRLHRHEAFLLEGPNLVTSALGAGRVRIRRVFLVHAFINQNQALVSRLTKEAVELIEVSPPVMKKLASTETPQGITAVASYRMPELEDLALTGLLVVCDGVQDPGNLGTLIRSADAFGVEGVVLLPGTCDAFSPKTLRATAGSVFGVPIVHAERKGLLESFKARGVRLIATFPGKGTDIAKADLAPPLAFALGNESEGISKPLMSRASLSVRIPIRKAAESLNVAVSASICLYEAARRLRRTGT
jgi:TrmH family RNA methyltransferase